MSPFTATTWYWGALMAAEFFRINRSESCEDPSAATWRGPWLGSSTSSDSPEVRCSMPMMVRE